MQNVHLSPDVANVRRRAKILMLVLVFSMIANLSFLLYAFARKAESAKQAKVAHHNQEVARKYREQDEGIITELKAEIESLRIL
jgi:hypothetical protein